MELKDPELLAELMEQQGVSARALAKHAGWDSHTYMQRLIKGQSKSVKPEPAARIAYRLGVPIHRLFVTKVSDKTGRPDRKKRAA